LREFRERGRSIRFWAAQEKKLADTPLKPQLELLSAKGSASKLWELAGDMPDGKKLTALLEIPADWDGTHALITPTISGGYNEIVKLASEGKWTGEAHTLTLTFICPGDATYTRWDSATDNNLPENVQQILRTVDYLKSRPDEKPGSIVSFGASRSGPPVLITAALRPADIAGVKVHVPTSCGISWKHKPYRGRGCPSGYDFTNPAEVEKFTAMSAYVDPVNFADDRLPDRVGIRNLRLWPFATGGDRSCLCAHQIKMEKDQP